MTLNEPLLKLWYIREYSERRRRVERRLEEEEEDSYKKGMNDKEWIYGRQLCLLLFSVQLHTVHVVNEKTIGNFKEQMVFKTRGWIAFVYTSPLKVCYRHDHLKTMKRKNIPVQLFSCSFHISLDKLWTHFLIHWIGDNFAIVANYLVY